MKTKVSLIIFTAFFLSSIEIYSQSCSYSHRKRIAIDPMKVSGPIDLTNFPVLINITSDNNLQTVANGGRVQNANGWDIIFTLLDGVTKLDHQIEKYISTTGEYVAYVKVPSVSTTYTTYIYMYYGKAGVAANPSLTSVWDTNYKGVYHFHSDYLDKTSTGNNGTNFGTTNLSCKVANGINQDNTVTRRVQIGTSGWDANSGTIELWGKPASFLGTETYFFGHTTFPAYNNRIQIYCINTYLRIGIGNNHAIGGNIALLTAGTWNHIVLTWTGAGGTGTFNVLVNGVLVYTGAYAAFTTLQTYGDVGNDGNSATRNEALRGDIDEFFVSNIQRTNDWEITCFNNQSSPSTFYSITSEPDRWIGGTNTNWGTASNWLSNAVPAAGADIIITNGLFQPTLDINRQISGMWIQSGATLSLSSNNLSFKFDITNCGTISGNSGTLTANSTIQCIEQYLSGPGTFNLNNLTINNLFVVTPSLRLLKDVNVNGALTLTSGIVYTTSVYILALSSSSSSSSGSAISYVSGPMSKNGTTAFVFPVGKNNWWRRIEISAPIVNTTFIAEYFKSAYPSLAPINAPLADVSSLEYWQLDRTSGLGNAIVSLYFEDATASEINNCPDLTIARWSGTAWDERPATTSGASVCSGTGTGSVVSNIPITAFSPFTFGSKSGVNPLPIELLNFDAYVCEEDVCLNWSTSTEINNDYFTIQKTKNGIDFEFVATIDGADNSASHLNYFSKDKMNYSGTSYYRLIQTDFNGDFSYSELRRVDVEENNEFSFDIYSNLIDGTSITLLINTCKDQEIDITMYDVLGKEKISKKIMRCEKGNNTYSFGTFDKLSAGIYFITASSEKNVCSKKLIVQ